VVRSETGEEPGGFLPDKEATPQPGVCPPHRTDPRRAASLSGYATPAGLLGRPPWRGFAGGGASDCRRRRGEARSGHRPGRTVCRPGNRARCPSQHLPWKHARRQVIRSGRLDLSFPSGTRHLHHFEPGPSRAIRGKQTFPSSFWTHNTRCGEQFLHVSLRVGRPHDASAPSSWPRRASRSHGRLTAGVAPTTQWSWPIVT
jgi:hypothetical protein